MTDIKWVDGVIPSPGVCFSCGSSDHGRRKFVTFTKRIKQYGQVLLCDQCVNSILTLPDIDFVPRYELQIAQTEAKVYREQLEPAVNAIRGIRNGIDNVLDRYLELDPDGFPIVKPSPVEKLLKRHDSFVTSAADSLVNTVKSSGFFDDDPSSAA